MLSVRRAGFSVIELLVVMGVVGVLVALLTPVLGSSKRSAQSVRCLANLKSIGYGLTAYVESNRGRLPYTLTVADVSNGRAEPFSTLAPLIGAGLPVASAQGVARVEPYACPGDVVQAGRTGFSYVYRPVVEFVAAASDPDPVGRVSLYYWGPPQRDVFICCVNHHGGSGVGMTNVLYMDGTAGQGR